VAKDDRSPKSRRRPTPIYGRLAYRAQQDTLREFVIGQRSVKLRRTAIALAILGLLLGILVGRLTWM
jgi:hypothetical protein